MFGGSRYFGLKGSKLNYAISIIAGFDFLLFGYDQGLRFLLSNQHLLISKGVMGGLLTLNSFVRTFPEIDVLGSAPEDRSHVSTIQGIAVASYNVGTLYMAIPTSSS